MAAVAPIISLSDSQLRVAQFLCVGGSAPRDVLVAEAGARASTLVSLVRLGVITWRSAGGRDTLYHLTKLGRLLICEPNSDGDPSGPYHETEDDMTETTTTATTTAKPDPKPTRKPTRKPRNEKAATPKVDTPVAASQDVTNEKTPAETGEKPSLRPLFEELVGAVKDAVKNDQQVAETKSYVRVSSAGKAVAYVHFPTSKAVRVEVPRAEGSGYDDVRVAKEEEIAGVLEMVAVRVETLTERAAAKAAAK